MATPLGRAHHQRLRALWRSAGWPCHDLIELDLLAAGLLERRCDRHGRDHLRVTDAGIALLAQVRERQRGARDAHETLVHQVAEALTRAGRIAWCGLSLRARVRVADGPADTAGPQWQLAMPDVFSVRHTSLPSRLEPAAHEIKVRRADLLADLKRPVKRAAYLDLAGECWYVLREGIGEASEVPAECGVLIARGDGNRLELLRPAPRRVLPHAAGLPFAVWMALARATPQPAPEPEQALLDVPEGDGFTIEVPPQSPPGHHDRPHPPSCESPGHDRAA